MTRTNATLVIVDAQKAFANKKAQTVFRAIEKQLVPAFSHIVACFYHNHPRSPCATQLDWHKCAKNTAGAEPAISLPANTIKQVRDTYSAAPQLVQASNLPQPLYLCGVETDACILATAFELFDKQHRFCIITDACTSPDERLHSATIDIMARSFGQQRLVTLNQLTQET